MPRPRRSEQVRIHLAGVGGAFGGREDLSMQIHGALLALHTNRPVKIVYNREESFTGHVHRHPARIWAEHRATRDGQARLGAHADPARRRRVRLELDRRLLERRLVRLRPLRVAERAARRRPCVYTNNPPCGAMRGFGAVQTCFAAEAQMDKLAAALEHRSGRASAAERARSRRRAADRPADRRLAPGRRGDPRAPPRSSRPSPRSFPRDPLRLPGGAGNTTRGEGVRRGVGFAVGFKNIAYSEGFDDYCAARVRLFADGSAEVHCAAAEVGQGVSNVILQVARTELGIDEVRLAPHSTATVGSAGSASASRQTWMVSGAVRDACRAALAERERDRRRRGRRRARLPPRARRRRSTRRPARSPASARTSRFAACAMRVVAEVDVDLGLTRVVWIGAAQDVGKAVNPQAVEGQIEGGTAQGLGLALMEEIQTRDGLITNASFTDYLIPTALDMPPVESVLIEDPEPDAPYGVKGSASRRPSSRPRRSSRRSATRPGRELTRVPVRADDIAQL